MKYLAFAALAFTLALGSAFAQTASSPNAKVYFINLKDGQHVKSPVFIQFGLAGMGVAPFGTTMANTGHHHLIVDADTPAAGVPIPMDMVNHIHFGRGQTETTVPLTPGKHTLQLVMGDGAHIPLVPSVQSEKITITVDP